LAIGVQTPAFNHQQPEIAMPLLMKEPKGLAIKGAFMTQLSVLDDVK
jgi:hypothetical protein